MFIALLPLFLCQANMLEAQDRNLRLEAGRGFGGIIGIGDGVDFENNLYATAISATLGYSFNHYLFLGGGISYYWPYSKVETLQYMRYFVDFRVYLSKSRISPFAGLKDGISTNFQNITPYSSKSLGVRWILDSGHSVDFMISLDYCPEFSPDMSLFSLTVSQAALLFQFCFEF